jgi:hypothetical protein
MSCDRFWVNWTIERRGAAQRSETRGAKRDTRSEARHAERSETRGAARSAALILIEPGSAVRLRKLRAMTASGTTRPGAATRVGLAAGCGSPVRTPTGCLVQALPVVASTECGVCCLSLVVPRICCRVGGTRDMSVEALFPQCRERFELGFSGCLWVLGMDAVGGPPDCDFADEGGARMTSGWCPDWWGVALAGVVLDLVGEVGDQLGSLGQIGPPDRMAMVRLWNAGEPRQWTWVGGRELW